MSRSSRPIGIALSGGGARGIAHVGVLQALEENGISPGFVSGVSIGAIVGVLYAAGLTPAQILSVIRNTRQYQVFRLTAGRGLMDLSQLKRALLRQVPVDDFGALEKRLFVAVANLTTGRCEIVSSGPALDWIVASASVPILFRPLKLHGSVYADGGLINNLPVEPLEERCEVVLGVNVTPIQPALGLNRLRQLVGRTVDLVMWSSVESRLARCHVAIEPDAHEYGFFETGKSDRLFEIGYEAAQSRMPEILKAVESAAGS